MKVKITTRWTLKRSKLGKVSSFHPHSMCKKVVMVTAKTGCTSCTNWTLSFEVSGFRTKTHLLHRLFKILITYYNSGLFAFIMHHSKPRHELSTLSDIIWYFWCIYWFFELYDLEIEKHYQWSLKRLKLGMVSSFHPHGMSKQVEMVTTKTGCTSCTNCTLSFEV